MSAVMPVLADVELSDLEIAVGAPSFGRGFSYAREGRVVAFDWDSESDALRGSVAGQGAVYTAEAYFADDDGALVFEEGECTCPVGYNCKHVVALVVAAAEGDREGGTTRLRPAPSATPRSSWDEPLRALSQVPAARTTGEPLAIGLTLRRSGGAGGGLRLTARLMRPGARGGWVNGSLTWGGLDRWHPQGHACRPDHLALTRELYAAHQAHAGLSLYSYAYRGERELELGTCHSSQLWPLLDEAARRGLALVHTRAGLGEVAPYRRGEILLDVTRGGGDGSAVTARLRVDDEEGDLEPLLFVGTTGHGVVCAERPDEVAVEPDRRRLRLVRLERPAPPQLQRLLLDGEPLEIPPGGLERFAGELCPALRHVAPVVSSDGTFAPPEISTPALVLHVRHDDHGVTAGWGWDYRIDGTLRRAPLEADAGGPGFRDPEAERAALADTDLRGTGLGRFGLLDDAGRPTGPPDVSLTGLDGMRLTTEELPRLEKQGIAVEVTGRQPRYRDVGDSLAIGVSTAELAGERDWFGLDVRIAVEGREVAFAEVFAALAGGETHMLLPDGSHFSLLEPRLQELRRLIDEARGLADPSAAGLRISRFQAGLWAELAALGVVTRQAQAWQRQVGALLELETLAPPDPPSTLAANLRPYQREGFGWLATLWELGLGGILADDMGLGKTLQALALVCHARAVDPGVDPFLVIAPTSVASTWVREAGRFAPGLRIEAVTDTLARSGRAVADVAAADVVVTTYTLFRLEADAYATVRWAGLILDEAQYVKNHQAKTYRCVRELDTPFKLAITGTPMENNLMELWSLLSITAPGLFPDPARFARQYARPIERAGDGELLARLRRRIKPLVKRRTKELVAPDLPAKQEQTLEIDLHPRHRRLYATRLQRERQKILGLIDDFDRNRFTILRSITLLRQLSLHPGLVDGAHAGLPCAKLDAFVEQLGDIAGGGHRALVFSQFTGFLAKVRDRLDREGVGHCYLDGRTRRRDRVIDRFRSGTDPVFLISLKAGGFGLNLTEADYCFLLDPWWNPAAEAQAIDRTHRIGQTRPVMVYRLIARDTIEEKVVALARRKAALFRGVMDEGDLFSSSLTPEDVRSLLG